MATRSTISIIQTDGVKRTIYCHWDGYPSNNGRILLEHYKKPEKVRELIDLGDISVLDKHISPPNGKEHSFSNRCEGVVLAYHRDRGEAYKDVMAREFYSTANIPKETQEWDYVYIEAEKKWYYRSGGNKRKNIVPLTEEDVK